MSLAKKLLMLAFVVALAAPVIGCGVGRSQADNRRAMERMVYYDARMMVDDLSLLALTHRPFRTSRWIID